MTLTRARFSGIALLAWVSCFAVLAHWGTWLPFAFVGVALASVALYARAVPAVLLRPSLARVAAGVLAGVLMVVVTHAAYEFLASVVPGMLPATRGLFWLLNVTGFSAAQRAGLIIVIASCEEVLFRGPLLGKARQQRRLRLTRLEFARISGFAVAYALTTAPLGSPLLIVCAFACGTVWGAMSIETGSLTMPILAHVIWDLGVLLIWPLSTQR